MQANSRLRVTMLAYICENEALVVDNNKIIYKDGIIEQNIKELRENFIL